MLESSYIYIVSSDYDDVDDDGRTNEQRRNENNMKKIKCIGQVEKGKNEQKEKRDLITILIGKLMSYVSDWMWI